METDRCRWLVSWKVLDLKFEKYFEFFLKLLLLSQKDGTDVLHKEELLILISNKTLLDKIFVIFPIRAFAHSFNCFLKIKMKQKKKEKQNKAKK